MYVELTVQSTLSSFLRSCCTFKDLYREDRIRFADSSLNTWRLAAHSLAKCIAWCFREESRTVQTRKTLINHCKQRLDRKSQCRMHGHEWIMNEWINKFYFTNGGKDRDMSYKKIHIKWVTIQHIRLWEPFEIIITIIISKTSITGPIKWE